MNIKKGEKVYTVFEYKYHWAVKADMGGLKVSYKVPKDLCPEFNDLEEYVVSNDMF